MKVVCILPITRVDPRLIHHGKPDVLEEDIVTGEFVKPSTGSKYYSLERFGDEVVFHAGCFAILPDESAEDMQAKEKEGIANLHPVFQQALAPFTKNI